jgi:EAL and modified HD-GYP domain-containing signal transduction protein
VVGRQPIFDRGLVVVGYELVFRSRHLDGLTFTPPGGDLMSADALLSSVAIGIHRLVADKKVFFSADRSLLTGAAPLMLPPERTVIEVVDSVPIDDDVVDGCRRLAGQGFTLALDGSHWGDGAEHLLDLVSILRIDVRALSGEELEAIGTRCRAGGVQLLAEKVDTLDELAHYQSLGFDFFQGYLLSRPKTVSGRAPDRSEASRLRLAAKLFEHECTVAEIERIVGTDTAMSHQLLHLAAVDAAGGTRRLVRSLREALELVGWRRLQSWVALLLMTDGSHHDDEETVTALVRARMAELVCEEVRPQQAGVAFAAGMLSSLDVFLALPIEEILDSLLLDPDLRAAALRGDSNMGRIIADVCDYQLGQPEASVRSGVAEDVLQVASVRALTWSVEMTTVMLEPELV